MFWSAKYTGTSSDMIECVYGQVELERMVKDLRPEWRVARDAGDNWGCEEPLRNVACRPVPRDSTKVS